ncbi:MAG TPA: hypothetical protein ENI27_03705 [bacterium]|nr:hypothetical protein [bacterium]
MPEKVDPLQRAEEILREKGITDDTILTAGTDEHEEARRWWQCIQCKAYIDVRIARKGDMADGPEFFVFADLDSVECPHCHCFGGRFDSVEPPDNPHFDERLPKYEAKPFKNIYEWATKWLRVSKSMISQCGFFPPDPPQKENEPQWPRDLAAVILASTIIELEGLKGSEGKDREKENANGG